MHTEGYNQVHQNSTFHCQEAPDHTEGCSATYLLHKDYKLDKRYLVGSKILPHHGNSGCPRSTEDTCSRHHLGNSQRQWTTANRTSHCQLCWQHLVQYKKDIHNLQSQNSTPHAAKSRRRVHFPKKLRYPSPHTMGKDGLQRRICSHHCQSLERHCF